MFFLRVAYYHYYYYSYFFYINGHKGGNIQGCWKLFPEKQFFFSSDVLQTAANMGWTGKMNKSPNKFEELS